MAGGVPIGIPLGLAGASLLGIGPKIGPKDPLTGRVQGVNLLGLAGLGLGIGNALSTASNVSKIAEGMKTSIAPALTATPQNLQIASQLSALVKAGVPIDVASKLLSPNITNMFRLFRGY